MLARQLRKQGAACEPDCLRDPTHGGAFYRRKSDAQQLEVSHRMENLIKSNFLRALSHRVTSPLLFVPLGPQHRLGPYWDPGHLG